MEQQQRQLLVKALNVAGRDATSVENPAYPGTPDIQYIGGWIECKYLEDWPVKEATTIRIPHFSPQQRVWLRRRAYALDKLGISDGRAWLVLYVAKTREWLLFDADTACNYVAKPGKNQEVHRQLAVLVTNDVKDIVDYVTGS